MNFQHDAIASEYLERIGAFMDRYVYPNESTWREQIEADPWRPPAILTELQGIAREQGLWNLFLPPEYGDFSPGLSNLQYAPLAELMGRVGWAPIVFNCGAPDTGNMEVLAKYGSPDQQERWLAPLLAGEIRSAFAMTEPAVASSDATNIQCTIARDGDDYVVNGRKWYITGIMNEACKVLIVMGKTAPDSPNRHQQQSQLIVPMDTPGIHVVRPMGVFGYVDPPYGHGEVVFEDVRVPAENLILGEGRGFEIAQGRLGPGRIHHCMRLIGLAQRALEATCKRAESRVTFGRKLSKHQSVREDIARMHCAIEQARLLTLKAADMIDRIGVKAARDEIAAIKIVAPKMACDVLDRAMQIHGAAGLSDDFFMAEAYSGARSLRLADGPDEVHMMQLGRTLAARFAG